MKVAAWMAVASAAFPGALAHAMAASPRHDVPARPNIVFLLADDLRVGAMGFEGHPLVKTPNLDALAKRGLVFNNSFVTTPICSVSRASILSGQYARRHGVNDFQTALPDLRQTYPALLRESGYFTGFIGKWGVDAGSASALDEAARTFDFWAGDADQTIYWHERGCDYVTHDGNAARGHIACTCPPEVRRSEGVLDGGPHPLLKDPVHLETGVIPAKVRQFLDQRAAGKPFNLSISFKAPHGPFDGYAKEFARRFEGARMPLGPTANPREAARQPEFLRHSLESPRGWAMAHDRAMNGKTQKYLRDYHRLVEGLDRSVGEIVAELERRGLGDNTVVILTSDNGHLHGEHGFFGKWLLYEESIRVPLIIADPRQPAEDRGRTSDALVLNIDLAPTMLALGGVPVPAEMQGISLVPLLSDPSLALRDSFFCEHLYEHDVNSPVLHIVPSEGLRTKDWKYIRYFKNPGPEGEQLFDLSADPLETKNLAGDPDAAGQLNALRTEYERLRIELGPHRTWTLERSK
ncbi:MAG: sulfatase [Chthoniobacterales bacterium]|nr:sulfatase [Chthoniobacterales bacterium]